MRLTTMDIVVFHAELFLKWSGTATSPLGRQMPATALAKNHRSSRVTEIAIHNQEIASFTLSGAANIAIRPLAKIARHVFAWHEFAMIR